MGVKITSVNCVSISAIEGTDCIGDTYGFLNKNFENLGAGICTLSATISASFNTANIVPKTTLGTLVSALSIFSTTGTYLGYIPIYK